MVLKILMIKWHEPKSSQPKNRCLLRLPLKLQRKLRPQPSQRVKLLPRRQLKVHQPSPRNLKVSNQTRRLRTRTWKITQTTKTTTTKEDRERDLERPKEEEEAENNKKATDFLNSALTSIYSFRDPIH